MRSRLGVTTSVVMFGAAALLLSACWPVVGSTGTTPTTSLITTIPASSSRTITVNQADSGHSYTLHKGDQLLVQLSGPSIYTWTEPVSSNQDVLQRTEGSPGTTANATFLAVAVGNVNVTSTDNPNCYPQCLAPSRLFRVGVTVDG